MSPSPPARRTRLISVAPETASIALLPKPQTLNQNNRFDLIFHNFSYPKGRGRKKKRTFSGLVGI